ncbi:MAG TPA: hypothetical protein PL125_06070 [Candidatus Omnitrophota bacterium]|nr:hypothetical protein [Candidatus Omnitrophota bacterium]HPT39742.1 hypothetical protein [Candidatus Omnitrophota bacterium]
MFKEVPLAVKIIVFINTIINLLLLMPLFTFVRSFVNDFFPLGLLVIMVNIILGALIILLKNWVRVSFIVMQVVGLVLSIWPFLCFLTLGLNGGSFGDGRVPWAPMCTFLFWKQIASFICGMSFPAVPMLFSIFCIIYLRRPEVKKQFN